MVGPTNLFTPATGTVQVALGDNNGTAVLIACTAANLPSAVAGYSKGCIAMATDTGVLYTNTGSSTSATFTAVDSSTSLVLPSAFTDSTTTTGSSFQITASTLTTGNGIQVIGSTANTTTGAALFKGSLVAAVAGNIFVGVTTGIYTGTGLLTLTASSATTGTIALISAAGLTTGFGMTILTGTALTTGANLKLDMGAATNGNGIAIVTTGVYTGTTGIENITANSATTGNISVINGTGLTTGKALTLNATAATLTTGFYIAANDGGLNVLTIGANGHITSNQTTAPTIAVTTQNGITAAALTTGATDVCGIITTTGTNNNGGNTVLTVTFNKTYTVAPKFVVFSELNNSAGIASIFSSTTATTFVLNIVASASSGATPSWSYAVIA